MLYSLIEWSLCVNRRQQVHKSTEELNELYKELCVTFYEYYDAFSEEVE